MELLCFALVNTVQAGQLSEQIIPDTRGLIIPQVIWFHSGLVFFILLIFFPFSLYLLTQRRCRRRWRQETAAIVLSLSLCVSLSLIQRYRCRNKGTHTLEGIAAAGESLRNSVKSVLKFALFYNQRIDFKCSGVFFASLLQSAQDVTPFLLSFYLVLPFRAMRNYLDVKRIVDSSCCAQHLEPQHSCPPSDVRV